MLVKFIPTKKAGTLVDAVLSYIFQPTDASGNPRPVIKQVAGTMPQLLSFLALSIPSKTPYTHSVLSFSDADMTRTTEADRLKILHSYIDELAAGLGDRQRMPYVVVDHGDHFHVVTLRWDLLSERVYQPFVKMRGDTKRFNAWKDVVNAKYGLDAPGESEALFRLDGKHVAGEVRELVRKLNEVGRERMREGEIGKLGAAEVVKVVEPVVKEHGFEVARVIKSGFSVTGPGMKRNVRIKFTGGAMGKKKEKAGAEDMKVVERRWADSRERLMGHMMRYHGFDADVKSTFRRHCIDKERMNEIHPFSAMA